MPDYSMMEPALALLEPYGPDLRNGLTSHAPMAVEALAALGRPDAVVPWLDAYRKGMTPAPSPRERIARDGWQAALGREDRFADWTALVEDELAEAPWRDVLARWTARLAPGICANATHGVIRTAHAARSLAESETPARRRELGRGIASWASTYQTLPAAGGGRAGLRPEDAIAAVPVVPMNERTFTGTIVGSLAALHGFPAFGTVLGLVDVSGDPSRVVSEMTETFARVCLTNAHDLLTAIVFVHGVTSTAALRSLLPYLDDATGRAALRYAWQAGSALYAAFGTAAPPAAGDVEPPGESSEALVEMAIGNGDEHAIKMTEACLREHAQNPSPVYLAAARRATSLLVAR
jgi:hypothetical protein